MSEKVTYNKHGMKPLSELTLLDRFLFSCAMEDPRILELSLRIIMGQELELQDFAIVLFLSCFFIDTSL